MPAAPRLRPLRLGLGFVLSAVALALVPARVDPGRFLEALRSVDPGWVLALAASRVGVLTLQAWRWHALLAGLGIPFREVLDGSGLGVAGNDLLPARAGEWLRIAWLSERSGRPAAALAVAVGAERLLDLGALALLLGATGLGTLVAMPELVRGPWPLALGVGAVVVGALVLGNRSSRLAADLREALRDRLAPRLVARAALRTGLLWAAVAGITAVGARTVGLHLTPFQAGFVAAAAALGGAVPSAPGNFGTFHLACAWALVALGFPPGPSTAAAVVSHGVSYLVEVAWGLRVGGAWLFAGGGRPGAR